MFVLMVLKKDDTKLKVHSKWDFKTISNDSPLKVGECTYFNGKHLITIATILRLFQV